MTRSRYIAALRGTACAAAILYSGAAAAQDYTSSIWFQLNWNQIYDLSDSNVATAEGALGATNIGLEQTALSQLNIAAARVAAGEGLSFDLNQFSGLNTGTIELSAENEATAWTTQLDALLGGSQVGAASFNTASFDVTSAEDQTGRIELLQAIDGDGFDGFDYDQADVPFSFSLGVVNTMDAAAAYAGTARIDAEMPNPTFGELIDNPDYIADPDLRPDGYDVSTPEQIVDTAEFVNGVQQAALSMNTLRGTADADTVVELYGQSFDVEGFSGRDSYDVDIGEDYTQDFTISGFNSAIAFSPRPASAEFVDPDLAGSLSDPSIANLDQIASVSLNTMTFGEEDGTADFSVLSLSLAEDDNYDGTDTGTAQSAAFHGYYEEVTLGNQMLATTLPEAYEATGGALASPYIEEREFGIGDVGLSDVSQTAALTVNSISQLGDGGLTLKDGAYLDGDTLEGGEPTFHQQDFVQTLTDLNLELSGEFLMRDAVNEAGAYTWEGDVTIAGLAQMAQFGFNAISSGGDVNGWNDGGEGIVQTIGDGTVIGFESVNNLGGRTDDGSLTASEIEQVAQISFNTLRAGGDLNAVLIQESEGFDIASPQFSFHGEDDVNVIDLTTDDEGNIAATDLSQLALLRLNSVSVDGTVTSVSLDQGAPYLNDVWFDEGINDFRAEVEDGNASVDGISQFAQLSINTLSAGAINSAEEGVGQSLDLFGDTTDPLGDENNVNEIDVISEDSGNALLKAAEQTLVLNLNTIAVKGEVSGDVWQNADIVQLDTDAAMNSVYVGANQDIADLRNVGGNASIDGLVQTLASSINTFSAGSLSGATIAQAAYDVDVPLENYAYVDAEWGVASAEGIVQTAINRVNYMSMASIDN